MAKIIVFSAADFGGTSKTFQNNDPDLTLNMSNMEVGSVIVVTGDWTLYPEPNSVGTPATLTVAGGPDADGVYRDYADWAGTAIFNVKSITHT